VCNSVDIIKCSDASIATIVHHGLGLLVKYGLWKAIIDDTTTYIISIYWHAFVFIYSSIIAKTIKFISLEGALIFTM